MLRDFPGEKNKKEWESRPSNPSSIRLIHFGRLLDDKSALKGSVFFFLFPYPPPPPPLIRFDPLQNTNPTNLYTPPPQKRLPFQRRRSQRRPHDRPSPRNRRRRRRQNIETRNGRPT